MISTATMLLIPVLPSGFCGALSTGRRAGGWLALSWVLTLAVCIAIMFAILFSHESLIADLSEKSIIMVGKAIGAAIAMSMFWIVTGVLSFFVIVGRGWVGMKEAKNETPY